MRSYAKGVGLLNSQGIPTDFCRYVGQFDPHLHRIDTQWLLHYFLCAPMHNGPAFWSQLVLLRFQLENKIEKRTLTQDLKQFTSGIGDRLLSNSTYESTATAFLGTYAKSDALGALRILEGASGEYIVGQPVEPTPAVFGYALADFWEHAWGDASTVNLARITERDGPAALFFLGSGATNRLLRALQAEGVLEVHRRAPPYQVLRLWSSADALLEKVYVE